MQAGSHLPLSQAQALHACCNGGYGLELDNHDKRLTRETACTMPSTLLQRLGLEVTGVQCTVQDQALG